MTLSIVDRIAQASCTHRMTAMFRRRADGSIAETSWGAPTSYLRDTQVWVRCEVCGYEERCGCGCN